MVLEKKIFVSIAMVLVMIIIAFVFFAMVLAWEIVLHAEAEGTEIVPFVMEMDMYIAIDVMEVVI